METKKEKKQILNCLKEYKKFYENGKTPSDEMIDNLLIKIIDLKGKNYAKGWNDSLDRSFNQSKPVIIKTSSEKGFEFQKLLSNELSSGKLKYENASLYTIILNLIEGSSILDVENILNMVKVDLKNEQKTH